MQIDKRRLQLGTSRINLSRLFRRRRFVRLVRKPLRPQTTGHQSRTMGIARLASQHERVLELFTDMRQRLGFGQGQGASPVEGQDQESEDR